MRVYALQAKQTLMPWRNVVISTDGRDEGLLRHARRIAAKENIPPERVRFRYCFAIGRSRAYIQVYRGAGTLAEWQLFDRVAGRARRIRL